MPDVFKYNSTKLKTEHSTHLQRVCLSTATNCTKSFTTIVRKQAYLWNSAKTLSSIRTPKTEAAHPTITRVRTMIMLELLANS
ncbi:hypothetical protein BX600DRAFT_445077 [Xylariales sp. PMI_506]|nr:hypothetical protein BX600DRAFT_445077 [Xylariales sp. PMI_506]